MSKLERYPKYKDSGVEWIGEIPEEWEVRKLKFLGKIYAGLTDKKGDDFSKKKEKYLKPFIPFTNIFNNVVIDENEFQYVRIGENEDQHIVQKGDLLFLMSSETLEDIGKTALYDGETEVFLNSFCKGFNIKQDKINSHYLNWLLQSNVYRTYFSIVGRGFTRINIKQDYVNSLFSLLPPKQEQTKIANYLDRKTAQIDKAISLKEQMIERLKERRQIIINDAVTKGLDKTVKMKDSGIEWIGEVPEHWEITKLGLCLTPVSIKNRADLPLLSVVREKGVILRDVENKEANHNFIPDDLSNYKVVEKEQFAMNKMKAWQGSYGVSQYTGIVSPAYYVFKLRNIEPDFFHIAIRSKSTYVPFFIQASDGVRIRQWDLSKTRMKEIPFYVPPKNEQKEIVEYIKESNYKIDEAIKLQQKQIEKLKEYKATLIDSVVTGKVRVV